MQKNNPAKPKTALKTKITLVIFGLFLFLIILEIALRLGGLALLSLQEYWNCQTIKQKGTYRILCIGESTTAGEYPAFLEEILNQRNIGIKFNVINRGSIAANTSQLLGQLESNINNYHPDMVVTMMGINDRGGHLPYEIDTTSNIWLFFKSFRIYKLSRLLWLHILTKAKETGLYKPDKDRQGSKKIQTYPPGVGLKEAYSEPVLDVESFQKAIELNPKDGDAYRELGRTYRDQGWLYLVQGKYPQAEESFQKAIELNPKDGDAYLELGWFYRDQGKYPQAEESFQKAIELNPEGGRACLQLGWLYLVQGKYPQAIESFQKAIELNPKDGDAYRELGRTYRDQGWFYRVQGKYPQAIESFQKAIELNPEDGTAYYGLGFVYQSKGKYPQAIESFQKAIELKPEDGNAYGAISVLYEEIGKSELTKEYANKVNRLRLGYYNPVTVNNYRRFKEILDKKKIGLVCVQYPMRSVEPLKRIFEGQQEGIVFVDNEQIFKDAIKTDGFSTYFIDIFGGDFGHCTEEGNWLLAENIANVILKEVFHK
ncbi:MAG: tetratricopeptide repeat protein [Candidatus Omnitrophota bacterium]